MRLLIFSLSVILLLGAAGCSTRPADHAQSINPLLGDISFVSRFGYQPTGETDENLRISTHLEYVERLLRGKDNSHLSPTIQARRTALLQLLHNYRLAGIFPKNYDYPNARKPCFIDRDGRICAVGYLVEHTVDREAAEEINRKYKYENLLAMNDASLEKWVASNGITKEEAAMIQPGYGYTPPQEQITPEYGISSAVLSGVNLSLAAMNGIQMAQGTGGKVVPAVGLAAGIGQVVLGATNFPNKDESGSFYGTSAENRKFVSMVNIGIGTTTIILSAWNLLTGRTMQQRRTSWNIYSFPVAGNNTGLAVSFTRRF